ncbi:hypothetical protein VCSRO82_3016 [Vibrio cholerae]|uniref:hypothetical protein n=1 Tax=Vibrio cholerae TaxID=666 RepID=UPI00118303C8|nr:hypothetical protein [Vibrio cholerae]TVN16930.1 hypothetical protein FPW20_12495 [Vibrio cholerae]TXZ37781.1 hypothetical protein FXE69_00160 [Vibrio cholerae]GHZ90009.1 hypothetical protein VCSRO82_3016 [Vibrio cholerae]HDZ9329446.1 hypothetical protein [Vibrio cholerae]
MLNIDSSISSTVALSPVKLGIVLPSLNDRCRIISWLVDGANLKLHFKSGSIYYAVNSSNPDIIKTSYFLEDGAYVDGTATSGEYIKVDYVTETENSGTIRDGKLARENTINMEPTSRIIGSKIGIKTLPQRPSYKGSNNLGIH